MLCVSGEKVPKTNSVIYTYMLHFFLGNTDMNTMQLFDIIGVDDIWIESVLTSNPCLAQKGLCVIMDVANYPWKMLKWLTPEYIKLCIKKIVALPFKDYRFHLVNTSVVVHVAIKITWPILPAYMKEMVSSTKVVAGI